MPITASVLELQEMDIDEELFLTPEDPQIPAPVLMACRLSWESTNSRFIGWLPALEDMRDTFTHLQTSAADLPAHCASSCVIMTEK